MTYEIAGLTQHWDVVGFRVFLVEGVHWKPEHVARGSQVLGYIPHLAARILLAG